MDCRPGMWDKPGHVVNPWTKGVSMPRPMHFEIHAEDLQRASRFYSSVFGWKIEKWGQQDYWLIKTGEAGQPGIDGGLLPRRGPAPGEQSPVNAFPCTIDV